MLHPVWMMSTFKGFEYPNAPSLQPIKFTNILKQYFLSSRSFLFALFIRKIYQNYWEEMANSAKALTAGGMIAIAEHDLFQRFRALTKGKITFRRC